MGDIMKGYTLNDDKINKIKKEYNNEYGLNYYENEESYEDYDRFFKTKNNLNIHDKIIPKR